jgi:hypothetical protein
MKRAFLLVALSVAACESKPDPQPVISTAKPAVSAPIVASAAPSSSASPAASGASSAQAGATSPFAGVWEGRYEAKRGVVTFPDKVTDKGWGSDDGETGIGAGAIKLTIGADGEALGTLDGALGASTVNGITDETGVRAAISPDESGPKAMRGVLSATLEKGALKGTLRVSGENAKVVREASFELKKRAP